MSHVQNMSQAWEKTIPKTKGRVREDFLCCCCCWVQFSGSVLSDSFDSTDCSQASLSITNSQSLLKLMSIESVMPFNHLIVCHPFLLLPSIFPSIRVFSSESALRIRWPKYSSLSFNISPSNEHPGLIFFRMDWLDLFAVQGTLKSLPTMPPILSRCLVFLKRKTLPLVL